MAEIETNITQQIRQIRQSIPDNVTLVAVSKYHPIEAIREAYAAGQRDFGESRVQELVSKERALRASCPDIRWHFIGHLQTNKVRELLTVPVHLIHSVDSLRLLQVIYTEAARAEKQVNVLLEFHVAAEASKSGFSPIDLEKIERGIDSWIEAGMTDYVHVAGIMGMATHTDDEVEIRRCFDTLYAIHEQHGTPILSMGMSEDYAIAIDCGSNMIRIGSAIFGERI